ncbi:hypothetical protein [uncultured Alistipes sp.]|uniref:hypothetical protein n=1 Tax=uncultured Alistipes sp. TaxID=538949 RepID=UPI0025EDBFC4|nr:hypothetical protein [uncultured Alistipes sp.]
MELKIYTKEGALRLVATSGDNDRATCGIQQESLLYLSFTAFECVALEVYDYAEVAGARYWVVERYRPKMNARREWVYNLQLHGIEALAAQTLMVNPTDGRDDPLLTLTAPAREHAALIVANLNRKMSTSIWKVGQVVVSEYIHIEYTGKYASDALSELAQAAGTEWWFDGTTLNVTRCEFGALVPLAYGDGLTGGITATVADGVKFFTRLFPVGSSRNIDPDKYGYGRLQLPDRATYVEQDTFLGIVEHYEQEAFAEIYPRRIGRVGTVRHVEKTGEDGEPFDIYYFTDPEIPFNPNDYEIGGLVKQITFQSGELRGRTFEVNYDAEAREFEIITQWPYDDAMQLPSPPLVPAPGDEYVLWNISLPESYYTAAEKEFREAVDAFMADARKDVSVFNAQTDFTIVDARKLDLRPGQRVRLQNPELFPETGYRDTRIVSVSRSLDNPGSMSLSMSDVLSQGRISRIESDIVRVEQLTRTISTEMPDIIRSWEETPASDATLYSSRKSEREFLNRRRGGDVEAPVRFRQGVSVGGDLRSEEYAAGMTGYGFGFGTDGRGEVESMLIRRFLEVPELRYNRTDVAVGDQWRAAGVGLVAKVAPADGTNGVVTLKLEEGEAPSLRPGDICMGIFHSLDASENATEDYDDSLGNRRFAGFATIYFTVTELLDEGHRFRYTLRPASEKYPRPLHPSPAMTFISYGSFTDPARRASVYATRTYERYLRDVADWEFTAANIAAQFGDLSNLSVHGIEMEGYSAYIDNLYMRGAMRSLDGMFSLDTRSKELLMAVPDSGIGLAFTPQDGLKIGTVYDHVTGQFKTLFDFEKMQQDIDDLGYLGKALHNDTQISGGLIQSSVLRMGYVDETSGRWIPRSGTSGIYDASKIGGGIAAWYGGDMLDKADYYTWDDEAFDWVLKPGVTPPEHIAQGLDRMDGTGYRAGGNFWWDADGNLHADPMSFFVGENTVGNVLQLFRYNFRDGASDQSFENVVSVTPRRPFTRLQIGEAMIEWDAAEDGIRIIRADGKPAGLYATKYVSSKGAPGGGETSGGASSLGQLVNVDEGADASATYDRVLVRLAGAMHWTTKRLADIAGLDTEALAEYLTANKYATQAWAKENFLKSVSVSGDQLAVVLGDGTTSQILPPRAVRADGVRDTILRRGSANVNFSNDGQLRHFFSSGSMTEGRPPMGDGHIIHMEWDNSL